MDMRKEINKLIKETDYKVMLQRTSRKIRCSCYNEKYQEPSSKCPKCLGTGWKFKFEIHRTFREDFSNSPEAALLYTSAGQVSSGLVKFYFRHDTFPKKGDYIWEVTWNNDKPSKLNSLYKIINFTEHRGETGKIEYKTVVAKLESIDKGFKNNYIGKAWRG